MKKTLLAAAVPLLLLGLAGAGRAEILTADYDYTHAKTALRGYAAYHKDEGLRPGVLIIHDWMGVGPYVRARAGQLAALGYVVLAADMYGKDVRPADAKEAAREAGKYRADRKLMRERAAAGLAALKQVPGVDPARVAVMGYCFGGGVALELARSGADLAGAASFHGNLDTPDAADARNIKGKIIVFHGADDPYVSSASVSALETEMRAAGVDWQLLVYGGAVHSFTNPGAGSDPAKGSAYNAAADRRSWAALQDFLAEIFKR